MLSTQSYPRAILHFDADSFFASVEQVMDHTLRGKVVVTGGERGAATSVSKEGKVLGLYRGMTLKEMQQICPDVVIVPGDYTSYSIFARRIYQIVREFTPDVEEYSIDECFADITGLRATYRMSYERIALVIKERLENDLGITFGVGLAPNKTVAKIASKLNKPAGFTAIPGKRLHEFLKDIPIYDVWGIGKSASFRMEKLGVHTALEFAQKDEGWLNDNAMSKPYRDLWLELRGHYIRAVHSTQDDSIGSILQSRTFKPTKDRAALLSSLAKNIEGTCAKARRHHVKGKSCRFYVKTQEFTYAGKNLTMSIPLSDPREFLRLVEMYFDTVFEPGTLYRASGFGLYSITAEHAIMPDLFGESVRVENSSSLLSAMDTLNQKYGRYTVSFASSMHALAREKAREGERRSRSRERLTLSINHRKKTLGIPYLGIAH